MNKPLETRLIDTPEARWQAEYAEQIGEDKPVVNRSGIAIEPLYTPRDFDAAQYEAGAGLSRTAARTRAASIRRCIAAAPGRSGS